MPARRDLARRIGVAVKRNRERRGWTQATLAETAGLHRVHVAQIERGAKTVSVDSLDQLARALKVSPWRLLR
jgi:transcriptional regulator with XRE-family HTH domain